MAQADVQYQDGFWLIKIPKGLLVFTESQFLDALRRGKWYQRRQAKQASLGSRVTA